jgi:hypothetical protein
LIDEIRANAPACATLFRASLRESYDTTTSSLAMEDECLVIALLGEIGGPELIPELMALPDCSAEASLHAQWAVARLGQKHPAEARAYWTEIAKADPRMRTAAAQHLFFLRESGVSRKDVAALLDGFAESATQEEAPYLLLTVSAVLGLMGSTADALATLKKHERQLSKQGRRWLLETTAQEEGFLPDLIGIGLDTMDVGAVCSELVLVPKDGPDDPDYDEEYEDEIPLVKPGRNDPCWCGSGKKYKKCHLDQDEREAREGSEVDRVFAAGVKRVLDFSTEFHRKSDMDRASKLFFDRRISEVDERTVAESGFVLWYLLDFRASAGARTVVEEYLRRHADRLDDRMRELIESWRDHRYGLWEVQRLEIGRGAEVREVFTGESYFVDDVSTSRRSHRWDCILSRLHRFEGKWLFLGDGFLVPRPLLPRLRDEVEAGARESGLPAAEYFRSRSHEWRRTVVEAHEEQWKGLRVVNFEGDPLEISAAEYEIGDTNAVASVLAGLPMFKEQTDAEDAAGHRVFGWVEKAEDGDMRVYGHLELADGKLRLECNSRRRLEKGRGLIEQYCGVFARHLGDSFIDLEEMKKSTAEGPPSPPSKPVDPELERELIAKVQAEHYAKWPDERLPALGGRTPRQAVRSKRGREQVEELLRDFENSSERARKEGRPAFDFSGLRSELGL